ncbi:hypothetical protein ACWC0C_34240 [Streptomyces sp. NPDC001709]
MDALTDEDLVAALGKLGEWQLIDVVQNHVDNHRTAEEHERRTCSAR